MFLNLHMNTSEINNEIKNNNWCWTETNQQRVMDQYRKVRGEVLLRFPWLFFSRLGLPVSSIDHKEGHLIYTREGETSVVSHLHEKPEDFSLHETYLLLVVNHISCFFFFPLKIRGQIYTYMYITSIFVLLSSSTISFCDSINETILNAKRNGKDWSSLYAQSWLLHPIISWVLRPHHILVGLWLSDPPCPPDQKMQWLYLHTEPWLKSGLTLLVIYPWITT